MRKTKKARKQLNPAQYAQKLNLSSDMGENIQKPTISPRKGTRLTNILNRLVRINRFIWIWVVLISSIATIYLFSAQTGETYSPDRTISIIFDHKAALSDIQSNLNSSGLKIKETKTINDNNLEFRTSSDIKQVSDFETGLQANKSIVKLSDYFIIPINPLTTYYPGVLGSLLLLAVLSIIAITIGLRKESLGTRFKVWALELILIVCFALITASLGIYLSKANLLLLTKSTFDLYASLVVGFSLIIIYIINNSDYRNKLLTIFYSN